MTDAWWLSIGLGAGLGLMYGLALLVTSRYAAQRSGRRFMAIFIGGMVTRMALTLLLVALVLVFLPVLQRPFIGSFLVIFLVGLAAEVTIFYRGRWVNGNKDS